MAGYDVLWQVGVDHAGIATQMVVERQLEAEGLAREQIGREKFEERVWQWKEQSGNKITQQLRRLGASVDWSREAFTMSEDLSLAVKEVFIKLYEQGLIYRGERLVNWDTELGTALSDLEVSSEEEDGYLWYINYFTPDNVKLTVATTRPETLLGDTALAVNPEDERYKELIGKKVILPITNIQVPIIGDDYVESGFGGGRKPEPASATGYPQDRYISNNSFLRYRYPQSYKRSMTITKFERNIDTTLLRSNSTSFGLGDPDGIQGGNVPEALSYRFVNVFPTSIQDIALSYSDSQVLQVTVNFAYDRYVMVRSSDVIGYTGGTINFPSDDIDDNSEALLESPSNVTNETEATTAK